MLTGDTGNDVSSDWSSYLPGGFSESDLAGYESMIGGEQLVMLPDSVQDAVTGNSYSYKLDFTGLPNFLEHDNHTYDATAFSYSQTETDDGEYLVTLKKMVVDLDVDDNDAGQEYSESLELTRYSWVVLLPDLSAADAFSSSGDLSPFGGILRTSVATWDYDFEVDQSGVYDSITVTMNFDSQIDFNWEEDLSYDRLQELGVLPDPGQGQVIGDTAHLSVNGSLNSSSSGTLTINVNATGFSYTINGSTDSHSDEPGLHVHLTASGALVDGANVDSDNRITNGDVAGSALTWSMDASITNQTNALYNYDGQGDVYLQNGVDRTGILNVSVANDVTNYQRDVTMNITNDEVLHDVIKLLAVSVDGSSELDDYVDTPDGQQGIDVVILTNSVDVDHSSQGRLTVTAGNGGAHLLVRTIHSSTMGTDHVNTNVKTELLSYNATVTANTGADESTLIDTTIDAYSDVTSISSVDTSDSSSTTTGTMDSNTLSNLTQDRNFVTHQVTNEIGTSTTTSNGDFSTDVSETKQENDSQSHSQIAASVLIAGYDRIGSTVAAVTTNRSVNVHRTYNTTTVDTYNYDGTLSSTMNGQDEITRTLSPSDDGGAGNVTTSNIESESYEGIRSAMINEKKNSTNTSEATTGSDSNKTIFADYSYDMSLVTDADELDALSVGTDGSVQDRFYSGKPVSGTVTNEFTNDKETNSTSTSLDNGYFHLTGEVPQLENGLGGMPESLTGEYSLILDRAFTETTSLINKGEQGSVTITPSAGDDYQYDSDKISTVVEDTTSQNTSFARSILLDGGFVSEDYMGSLDTDGWDSIGDADIPDGDFVESKDGILELSSDAAEI